MSQDAHEVNSVSQKVDIITARNVIKSSLIVILAQQTHVSSVSLGTGWLVGTAGLD